MNNKERKMFAKHGMQRVRQEHTPRFPVKFAGEMAVWDHREPERARRRRLRVNGSGKSSGTC